MFAVDLDDDIVFEAVTLAEALAYIKGRWPGSRQIPHEYSAYKCETPQLEVVFVWKMEAPMRGD